MQFIGKYNDELEGYCVLHCYDKYVCLGNSDEGLYNKIFSVWIGHVSKVAHKTIEGLG